MRVYIYMHCARFAGPHMPPLTTEDRALILFPAINNLLLSTVSQLPRFELQSQKPTAPQRDVLP